MYFERVVSSLKPIAVAISWIEGDNAILSDVQRLLADVLKELQNLDPYKSAGLDNLDPLFLKLSVEIVATSITSLFNISFVSSEIPKDWKAAAVIPLFKGGDTRPKLLQTYIYPALPF